MPTPPRFYWSSIFAAAICMLAGITLLPGHPVVAQAAAGGAEAADRFAGVPGRPAQVGPGAQLAGPAGCFPGWHTVPSPGPGTFLAVWYEWCQNVTRGQTAKIVANTFFPGCVTPARR